MQDCHHFKLAKLKILKTGMKQEREKEKRKKEQKELLHTILGASLELVIILSGKWIFTFITVTCEVVLRQFSTSAGLQMLNNIKSQEETKIHETTSVLKDGLNVHDKLTYC